MTGFVFSFTVIISVAQTGNCWMCPTNKRLFTDVGQHPVLPFTTDGRHNDTTDINTFLIATYTGTNIFTINYENGVVLGTPFTKRCSLASSADIANGVLNIELETVQKSDWGTYSLIYNRANLTAIQCVTLYVLGTPTTPLISSSGTSNEGMPFNLTCNSTSTTQPSNHSLSMRYKWIRDGSIITADNKFTFDSDLQATLKISSLSRTEDNTRVVQCSATEKGGKSSQLTFYTISVQYGPDNFSISPSTTSYMVTNGDTLGPIRCSATCNPACTFTWSKSGKTISTMGTLELGQMKKEYTGSYVCTAQNPGSGVSRNGSVVNVNVKYAPDVFISPSTIKRYKNTPLDLLCKATGIPAVYTYTGFVQRIGDVEVPNSHIESPGVRDSISVNIPSLQLQDTGIYTCYVHNGIIGENKQLIQNASQRIDVLASPIVLVKQTTFAGEKAVNLTISIPFVSVPEYTTYSVMTHKGQIVSKNEKYTLHMRKDSVNTVFYGQPVTLAGNVLRIDITNLSEDDFGLYNIKITNNVNTSSFNINVTATSKPSPPTELNLTTLDNVVTFKWKKGFNGGHEQTFLLQTSLISDGLWMNRTAIKEFESKYITTNGNFEVKLTNLDPGMYRASLIALNVIGAADPVEFKDSFVIRAKPASSSGALIAGATGGGLGVTLLAVVAVVIFLKKRKTQKGHGESDRLRKGQSLAHIFHRTGQADDTTSDEVQNPMYEGADDVDIRNAAAADISAQPLKKKPKQEACAGDIYAVVNKEKKKQDIYENRDDTQLQQGTDSGRITSDSKTRPVDKAGLVYADLVFENEPKGQRKLVVNAIDDMTEYAEVDVTMHANPLPDRDN